MSYTALVLDEESQYKLLAQLRVWECGSLDICRSWEKVCHHMTINLGDAEDGPAANLVGQEFEVIATSVGYDNRVVAVGVESVVPSKNKIKHITVAVNVVGEGKAKHSNELTKWTPLDKSIVLRGVVRVVR